MRFEEYVCHFNGVGVYLIDEVVDADTIEENSNNLRKLACKLANYINQIKNGEEYDDVVSKAKMFDEIATKIEDWTIDFNMEKADREVGEESDD